MKLPGIERRRKKFDLFRLAAEMLDQLRESFFSIIIGALPYRCLDERKHRRQRRLFARYVDEWNSRARPCVGIVFVAADQLLGEQRNIVDRTREQPNMI